MHVKLNLAAKIRGAAFTKRNVRYLKQRFTKKGSGNSLGATHTLKKTNVGGNSIPNLWIFDITYAIFLANLLYNFTYRRIVYMRNFGK